MSPLVSILTPVYKGEHFISNAIESVLAQTYPNFELLIVNDGSPDESADVIRPYLVDPRIRYFEQPNAGVAAARNCALAHASGKYVGFLDQDDLWLKDKLAFQVEFMEAHPDVALVHTFQEYVDESGGEVDTDFINVEPVSGNCFPQLFEKNRIAVLTVLVRRAAILEVGGLNSHAARADDYELWLQISLRYPIGFLDKVVARYRVHNANASHDAMQMTEAELIVINSILSQRELVESQVGRAVIRKRLAELHRELGEWQMWKKRNYIQARRHFTAAAYNDPFSIDRWRSLLWCSFTPSQRTALSWWGAKLHSRFPLFVKCGGATHNDAPGQDRRP